MLNFANSTLTETNDSTADATGSDAETPRDGGPEVTPLFTAPDDRSGQAPPESGGGPATQDQPVRDQVQRIRLDLLARETERLDRRLEQILDQQREDRQQREGLQGELANLCRRVDKLIVMKESEEGGGGEAGADLRDTVKPLLQAVLQMLDGPLQKSAPQSGSVAPAQAPQPPVKTDETRQQDTGAGPRAPAPQTVTARYPQPSASTARPAGTAATPQPPPERPQVHPDAPPIGDVEATAAALHNALSRLDLATKSAARARTADPNQAAAPNAATHRQDPAVAGSATRAGPAAPVPGDGPAQERVVFKVPPMVRQPETRPGPQKPPSKAAPDNLGDTDDSLGIEDPTIEIARLLRPVNARTEAKPVGRQPEPRPRPPEPAARPPEPSARPLEATARPPEATARHPERRRAGESEPLQLGTPETPEIIERPERLPHKPGPGDVPAERPVAAQAPMKSGGVPPAGDARAPDRSAPATTGGQGTVAASTTQSAGTDPASRGITPPSGLESPCEALPKCLTEPWDDAESGRRQAGQDKSPRRWPFRRTRSTGEATDRPEDTRSAPGARRSRFDDGSDSTK